MKSRRSTTYRIIHCHSYYLAWPKLFAAKFDNIVLNNICRRNIFYVLQPTLTCACTATIFGQTIYALLSIVLKTFSTCLQTSWLILSEAYLAASIAYVLQGLQIIVTNSDENVIVKLITTYEHVIIKLFYLKESHKYLRTINTFI
jgi:hypothetical protein